MPSILSDLPICTLLGPISKTSTIREMKLLTVLKFARPMLHDPSTNNTMSASALVRHSIPDMAIVRQGRVRSKFLAMLFPSHTFANPWMLSANYFSSTALGFETEICPCDLLTSKKSHKDYQFLQWLFQWQIFPSSLTIFPGHSHRSWRLKLNHHYKLERAHK